MLPFSDFWTVSSQASPSSSLKQAGTHCHGSSTVAQWEQTQLVSMRMRVPSLASISRSGIWHCCALWCRFQIWLRTLVAVAVVWASSSNSNLTSRLGTSICRGCGPKKTKKKRNSMSHTAVLLKMQFWDRPCKKCSHISGTSPELLHQSLCFNSTPR